MEELKKAGEKPGQQIGTETGALRWCGCRNTKGACGPSTQEGGWALRYKGGSLKGTRLCSLDVLEWVKGDGEK